MILTAAEQETFKPGIYRTTFDFNNGVPGVAEPFSDSFDIEKILKNLQANDMTQHGFSEIITGKERPTEGGFYPERSYFPSIDAFVEAWKRGYETGVSQFGTNQVYNKLGFELFYVNWKPDSDFFSFGDYTGIFYMGDRPELREIMVAGDNNGMNDQKGFLNLGVNDFRTCKVLVYRELDEDFGAFRMNQDEVDLTPDNPKHLRNDLKYYTFSGEDRFPFGPPNRLKSFSKMWTAVGIDPSEIYSAFEKLGFVFPASD